VAHLRLGIAVEHFVEFNRKSLLSVKEAFRKVVKLCELDLSEGNVTPHTICHTAATWLMQAASIYGWRPDI
jgi:integrase